MFQFPKKPEPVCRLCKRKKGDHKAQTLNCPMTRHQFTPFHPTQVFEAKP